MEIQAALVREPHSTFSIETVELDEPKAGEVLVKLTATGICHTDIAIVEQIMPLPMPIVLGHEGAGVVVKVGPNVKGLAVGDHVVLAFASCGHCASCDADHPAYCANAASVNYAGRRTDGSPTLTETNGTALNGAFFGQSSFATYAISSERNAIKVSPEAPLKLLGPLGCGLMTGAGTIINVLKPGPNSTLGIFGAGALGFAALFAAKKILGTGRVVVVDRVQSRLDLALELGADVVINTSKTDLAEALAALGGLDCAMDTTGVGKVLEPAIGALKPGCTLVMLGASHDTTMTLSILHMISGRVIRGVIEGDSNPPEFIPFMVEQYLKGNFPIDRISKYYAFSDINEAIADTASGATIKPILVF